MYSQQMRIYTSTDCT